MRHVRNRLRDPAEKRAFQFIQQQSQNNGCRETDQQIEEA